MCTLSRRLSILKAPSPPFSFISDKMHALSPALCAKRRTAGAVLRLHFNYTPRVWRRTRDKAKLISSIYLRVTDAAAPAAERICCKYSTAHTERLSWIYVREWVSEREDDLRGRILTHARKTRHSRAIKSFLLQAFPPGFAVKFMRVSV